MKTADLKTELKGYKDKFREIEQLSSSQMDLEHLKLFVIQGIDLWNDMGGFISQILNSFRELYNCFIFLLKLKKEAKEKI